MAETTIKLNPQTQICKCCGKELPLSAYRSGRLGLLKTCKECVRNHQIQSKLDKKIARIQDNEVENAKKARLADFTPRELMAELKRRGYEFTMTYTEVHTIKSDSLDV